MHVEVWEISGCARCDSFKHRLRRAGLEIVVRDLLAVQRAEIRDVEVLTQLTMQNGKAPVIRAVHGDDGMGRREFVEWSDFGAWLEKNGENDGDCA